MLSFILSRKKAARKLAAILHFEKKTFFTASQFTDFNGTIYFAANDGSHGTQLWKTNETRRHLCQRETIGELGY